MTKCKIRDGKIIIGEGLDAIAIEGSSLTIQSLVNKIEGHYPDNYPWYGYREDGFDEAIANDFANPDFPPNNIPVSKLPACIRAMKGQISAMQSSLNVALAKLADLDATVVRAEVK